MSKAVILVPSFNSAATIVDTFDSLQCQTTALRGISAVYLADDCSQDESISLAKANWRATVPLHVLKRERNFGERENVNRAIEMLGDGVEWLLLLHSDDLAKPHWLSVMLSRIEACTENVGSICSSWDTLLPDGSIVLGEDDSDRGVETIEGTVAAVQETLKRGCWWHISGCAIRLRAFNNIGDFDSKLPQLGDWEWLLRCLNTGWAVEYVPRTLILYRQHESSVSSVSFQKDRDVVESLEIVRRYIHLLSKRDLISFHLRRGTFMVRRFVRAAVELRLQRCLQVTGTMALIWRNLFQSLQERVR